MDADSFDRATAWDPESTLSASFKFTPFGS